jgi:glycine dehydrogenase subunit 1
MRYLPKSPAEREKMLAEIGAGSIDDLFADIPAEYRLDRDLDVPRQQAESEIVNYFRAAASKNSTGYTSFLGAGAYRHYRPVIIDALVQRGEFLTSYTPYQAEITQGTLQAIFEFQTMIAELTAMDVANASMYDGSTGASPAATRPWSPAPCIPSTARCSLLTPNIRACRQHWWATMLNPAASI